MGQGTTFKFEKWHLKGILAIQQISKFLAVSCDITLELHDVTLNFSMFVEHGMRRYPQSFLNLCLSNRINSFVSHSKIQLKTQLGQDNLLTLKSDLVAVELME